MRSGGPSRWFWILLYVFAVALSIYLADYWKRGLSHAYERRAPKLHQVQDNTVPDAPSAHDLQTDIDSHLKDESER
ncbi:MAG: hypothetical protein ACREJQ_01430 [bacterium]